jgi:uncharacterized protein YggE
MVMGVTATAKTVKGARAEVAPKARKILDTLTALKIPGFRVESSTVNVEQAPAEKQDEGEAKKPTQGGAIKVTHTFTILIRNKDAEQLSTQVGRVLDSALHDGGNFAEPIEFFKEDLAEVRRATLVKAAEDARANADALAHGAKVTLKELVDITDEYPANITAEPAAAPKAEVAAPEAGAPLSTPIVAGDIEVSCRVWVTYSF